MLKKNKINEKLDGELYVQCTLVTFPEVKAVSICIK